MHQIWARCAQERRRDPGTEPDEWASWSDVAPVVPAPRTPERIEWPTVAVALAVWGGWFALVLGHRSLPWPLQILGLALIGGWYLSLQHEVVHGHPTPWRGVNLLLAGPPMSLWLPFDVYRRTHLEHHEVELTVPGVDPESFYVDPRTWSTAGPIRRSLWRVNRTMLGRLLVGPSLGIPSLLRQEAVVLRHDRRSRAVWARHLLGAAIIGSFVIGVVGMPWWQYVLGAGYFSLSVGYIRSFVEHLAVPAPATRSAVVRSGYFFGVLFLFNNLHHTHHARPGVAWYRLPALTEQLGSADAARDGAGYYRGYAEVFRRFAVRPFSVPVHPLMAGAEGAVDAAGSAR